MDRDDFITLEIVPTLGDYASDYDLQAIYDIDAYSAVLQRHDISED